MVENLTAADKKKLKFYFTLIFFASFPEAVGTS